MGLVLRRFSPTLTVDLGPSRAAREHALPARAEVLQAESWGNWDCVDPGGNMVTIPALDVLDEDLARIERAFDDGEFEEAEIEGGIEYRVPPTDSGPDLVAAIDRLADFDLLAASAVLTAHD